MIHISDFFPPRPPQLGDFFPYGLVSYPPADPEIMDLTGLSGESMQALLPIMEGLRTGLDARLKLLRMEQACFEVHARFAADMPFAIHPK